jgi:hypothetical protein
MAAEDILQASQQGDKDTLDAEWMLTPNFTFLSKRPIILPNFPNPLRTSTADADTIVLALYGSHHGCRHLEAVRKVHHEGLGSDIKGEAAALHRCV